MDIKLASSLIAIFILLAYADMNFFKGGSYCDYRSTEAS